MWLIIVMVYGSERHAVCWTMSRQWKTRCVCWTCCLLNHLKAMKDTVVVQSLTAELQKLQCCYDNKEQQHKETARSLHHVSQSVERLSLSLCLTVSVCLSLFVCVCLCLSQVWASECPDVKNYKWRLNPVWHRMLYVYTHMATVGVKGLRFSWDVHRVRWMPQHYGMVK